MSGPLAPGSSYLVQEIDEQGREWSIVVDLGPGAFGNLWNYTSPQKIDALFFSHWHADHCSDALSMHVYRRWHPRITFEPLPVYSPGNGLERLRQLDGFSKDDAFNEFIFHDFGVHNGIKVADEVHGQDNLFGKTASEGTANIHLQSDICNEGVAADNRLSDDLSTPGAPITIGPLRIIPYQALHTVPAVSLRIESLISHAVLTYTGDTDMCPGVRAAAKDVDLLLSEAGFTDDDPCRGVHLSGVRAGQLAAEGEVGQLVLTHIQPWTDLQVPLNEARSVFQGKVKIAQMGDIFQLGD